MTEHFGCVNNTIRLRSGLYLDLLAPSSSAIDIRDIAGGLSKICRFGGQCENFYTVAEHCIGCVGVGRNDGLDDATLLALLLHDATEAYIGDVVKPLKVLLPRYAQIEASIEHAIAAAMGVDFHAARAKVLEIDHAMLIAERRALFTPDDRTWAGENEVRRVYLTPKCMPPAQAEAKYLDEFWRLVGVGPEVRR